MPSRDTEAVEAPLIAALTLGELAGSGGFADVFRARDASGEPLAVKIVRDRADERIDRELSILRGLGPPHVPAVVRDGVTTDGRRYIAMEDLGIDSLAARLARRHHADPGQAIAELDALCAAVDAVHAAGVVHRDLKPENVFFRDDGTVAIIDFGLAWRRDETAAHPALTRTGARMGTLTYMAPEQWSDAAQAGCPADIYAIGVMAFEILAGQPPFSGDFSALRLAHATARCPDVSALASVPESVDALLAAALAKDPARRPASAGDVARSIERALHSSAERVARPTGEPGSALVHEDDRALLLVHGTRSPLPAIVAAAGAHDAVLYPIDEGRFLFAFPDAQVAPGLRAAARLARTLLGEERDHRAVIHVAPVRVRRGPRGTSVIGAAVRDPRSWAIAAEAALTYTPEARRYLTEVSDKQPVRIELAPIDPDTIETRGRTAVYLDIEAYLGRSGPHLLTVIGAAGGGKTRALTDLARALRPAQGPVHYLRARSDGAVDALARQVLCIGLDLNERDVDAAGLDAAWARRAAPAPAVRAASALVMGVVTADSEPVGRLLRAPGALRQATARALSLALGRAARRGRLVLLLDDAHLADHAVLDGLELATMDAGNDTLTICASALPALTAVRPAWGNRAVASATFVLPPLTDEESRALLADLLRPVEFVPGPAIARLCELGEGVPSQLVELAHAVRGSGVVRQSPGRAGYIIASDELLEAAARPLIDRLSNYVGGRLSESVAPFAHLCALLPDGVDEETVDGVRRMLPASDGLNQLDGAAALARLARQEILVREGSRYRMRRPLQAAIERLIPHPRRRALHAAALAFLRPAGAGLSIAHHAVGAGEHEVAAAELCTLGDRARARHRYVAAEQHYSAALEHAAPDGAHAEAALAGRGSVRYRLQRFDEAIADLRAARACAHRRGDRRAEAELMFEEATALDWTQNWTASAALARQALPLARADGDPALLVKAELALARSAQREQRYDEAVASLEGVIVAADRLDLYEERVIARLVLGAALLFQYRLDEAERNLEQVIEICQASGDDLHLAAAHTNRQMVAVQRHDVDRALADLSVCIRLSRELGNAQLERAVSFNYGELELWRGNLDTAFAMAIRAHELQIGFQSQYSRPEDALLLARIECARRRVDEAARHLTWIHASCSLEGLPPVTNLLLACVTLFTSPGEQNADARAWSEIVNDPAAAELVDERVEMLLLGAEAMARHDQRETAVSWHTAASEVAGGSSLWETRLQITASRILP